MTRRLLRAALLAGIASISLAAPAMAQRTAPTCSLICQSEFAREEVRNSGQQFTSDWSRQILTQPSIEATAPSLVESALAKYTDRRETLDRRIFVAGVARDVVSVGFALYGDLSNPVGISVAGTVGAITDIAFDRGIEYLEEKRDEEVSQILDASMDEIRQTDAAEYARLAQLDPEAQRARLFGSEDTEGLFNNTTTYRNLDPAARAIIADAKTNILADAVRRGFQDVDVRQTRTESEIRQISQRLVNQERRFEEFKSNTSRSLNELREAHEGLRDAVDVLSERVQGHSYRLAALERVTFRQLSPREQVQELRSGTFSSVVSGMTADERRRFERALERAALVQSAQEMINDTRVVIGGLNGLAEILNLQEELARPLAIASKGVQIAQILLTASSGSPLAIMSALGAAGGLFGGGGDNGMSALRAEIQALRRDIQEMRREMFEYHRQTMQALGQISEQIDATYRSLYRQGETSYQLLAFVERGVNELLTQDIESCHDVLDVWSADAPYEERRSRLNGFLNTSVVRCRQGIETRFNPSRMRVSGPGASTIFFLRDHPAQVSDNTPLAQRIRDAQEFERVTLASTVAYTQRYALEGDLGPCEASAAIFAALVHPVLDFGDGMGSLDMTARACAGRTVQEYRLFTAAELANPQATGPSIDAARVLRDLISAHTILEYGNEVVGLSSMWEFATLRTGRPRLATMAEAAASRLGVEGSDAAVSDLRRVRDFVNVAIAQQNLLAGDAILPVLGRQIDTARNRAPADFGNLSTNRDCEDTAEFQDADSTRQQLVEYRDAICTLARNALLRQNFILHWTRNGLRSFERGPIVRYAASIDSSDPMFIRDAFRDPPQLIWGRCRRGDQVNVDGWCARISAAGLEATTIPELVVADGYVLLPLPRWEDLAAYRPARLSPHYGQLFRLRDSINDRLATYVASRSYTPSEREVLFAGTLAAAGFDGRPVGNTVR